MVSRLDPFVAAKVLTFRRPTLKPRHCWKAAGWRLNRTACFFKRGWELLRCWWGQWTRNECLCVQAAPKPCSDQTGTVLKPKGCEGPKHRNFWCQVTTPLGEWLQWTFGGVKSFFQCSKVEKEISQRFHSTCISPFLLSWLGRISAQLKSFFFWPECIVFLSDPRNCTHFSCCLDDVLPRWRTWKTKKQVSLGVINTQSVTLTLKLFRCPSAMKVYSWITAQTEPSMDAFFLSQCGRHNDWALCVTVIPFNHENFWETQVLLTQNASDCGCFWYPSLDSIQHSVPFASRAEIHPFISRRALKTGTLFLNLKESSDEWCWLSDLCLLKSPLQVESCRRIWTQASDAGSWVDLFLSPLIVG